MLIVVLILVEGTPVYNPTSNGNLWLSGGTDAEIIERLKSPRCQWMCLPVRVKNMNMFL